MRSTVAQGARSVVATHGGNVIGEVVVSATYAAYVAGAVSRAMTVTEVVVMMVVVMVMVMEGMIPEGIVPAPVVTVPIVRTIPIVVIVPRVIVPVVIWIVVSVIIAGIEAPVPGVAYIHIGGAAAGVVVVIIVERSAGSRSETLDAGCEVGIVIGFGGGVNHTVGVSHSLSVLIYGFSVRHIVLAVGIIGLIIVGAIAADAWRDGTFGLMPAWRVVRRIIGVVISHPLVGAATHNCEGR